LVQPSTKKPAKSGLSRLPEERTGRMSWFAIAPGY
jgi:hypothetical protein